MDRLWPTLSAYGYVDGASVTSTDPSGLYYCKEGDCGGNPGCCTQVEGLSIVSGPLINGTTSKGTPYVGHNINWNIEYDRLTGPGGYATVLIQEQQPYSTLSYGGIPWSGCGSAKESVGKWYTNNAGASFLPQQQTTPCNAGSEWSYIDHQETLLSEPGIGSASGDCCFCQRMQVTNGCNSQVFVATNVMYESFSMGALVAGNPQECTSACVKLFKSYSGG